MKLLLPLFVLLFVCSVGYSKERVLVKGADRKCIEEKIKKLKDADFKGPRILVSKDEAKKVRAIVKECKKN